MPVLSKLRSYGRPALTLIVGVGALVLGGMVFGVLASMKAPPQERVIETRTYNVEVFAVEPARLQEMIPGFGAVQPDRETVLSAEVSGRVLTTHEGLDVGRPVTGPEESFSASWSMKPLEKGPLVEVDPSTYRQRLAQIDSRIEELKAQRKLLTEEETTNDRLLKRAREDYDLYEKEFARARKAFQSRSISPSQFTQDQLQFKKYEDTLISREREEAMLAARHNSLDKQIESAEVEKTLAQLDVDRATIMPPFSGIVSEVMVEEGQYVRVGDPLLRLTDVNRVIAVVPITLDHFAKLEPKLRAGEHPRALLGESETGPRLWTGRVKRVSPKADAATRTIDAFVEIDNTQQDLPLLPGTFVHALIEGPIESGRITIPRDAITSSGSIFVDDGGVATEIPVELERTLQSLAIVRPSEPLPDSAHVILTNLDILSAGMPVERQQVHTLDEALSEQRTEVLVRH